MRQNFCNNLNFPCFSPLLCSGREKWGKLESLKKSCTSISKSFLYYSPSRLLGFLKFSEHTKQNVMKIQILCIFIFTFRLFSPLIPENPLRHILQHFLSKKILKFFFFNLVFWDFQIHETLPRMPYSRLDVTLELTSVFEAFLALPPELTTEARIREIHLYINTILPI